MTSPIYSRADVMTVLDAIHASEADYTGGGKLRPHARALGEELMRAYGYDGLVWQFITDTGLRTLYAATVNNATQGAAIASKLADGARTEPYNPILRYRPEPQPAPEPPYSPEPQPAPEPEPPYSTLPPVQHDMSRYALQRSLDALADRVRLSVNTLTADIDVLRDSTADTLQKLTAAIPANVSELVQSAIADALKALQPVTLQITTPALPEPKSLGMVHHKTPQILRYLMARKNVYLHGPAGSGKTTVARKCAVALGVAFRFAAKVESEYQLMGYTDAGGRLVRTQFREAYEHGGLFLFDELDASSPSAVVALNAALANGICAFPDATIERHPDFYCIAAGNTTLSGANRAYQGRNQLDGASVDRFMFVEFGYDEALERGIAPHAGWCRYVQAARKAVADRGLVHLVTPRATIDGGDLINAGEPVADVLTSALWKGLDADTVDQLQRAISVPLPQTVGVL